MKKIAVFPGSFDPITKGHESIIKKAIPLFDEIIVAVGENLEKKYLFSLEQRMQWVKTVFAQYPSIRVDHYKGLTIDFCKNMDAQFIIRGVRTAADFEFERSIGQINKVMSSSIETLFFLAEPEFSFISSSIVRDIYLNGGDVSPFTPNLAKIKK